MTKRTSVRLVSFHESPKNVYYEQLYNFFCGILSYLAAYRRNYGCQHVLTKIIQDCKSALDKGEFFGMILMDLSKAFDCSPHRLLLCKLRYCGITDDACTLLMSYLSQRKQRVKIGRSRSYWGNLSHGVPQGYILGPLIFNTFLNDVFYVLDKQCNLYDHADDNTLVNSDAYILHLKSKHEKNANMASNWFANNNMKSILSKFQAMVLNNHPDSCEIYLRVANTDVQLNDCVKLLGVYIDYELKFTNHVDHLCKRTSRQLSAIRRIAKYLNKDCIMKLFNAFILSNFNYSSIVWHFFPHESTSKVEKIKKSALRIVLNDYKSNNDTLLQLSNLQPLLISRFKAILYEVYKCTREINPSFMNELFSKIIHPYHTRSGSMLTQPRASSIKYGINNFVFQGAKLWNSLPASAKGLENPYDFK